MNIYDQLSALDGTRTNWKVKVRVTRMWPSISTSGAKEKFNGYNLLLLDEENCHIHAFVYADTWNTLSKKIEIEEGAIYVISNFYAKNAFSSLRPVSTKTLINFSNSTTVEKINEDDPMIPMHKFEFVDLGDLADLASSYTNPNFPDFSTDIMGAIEEYEDLQKIDTVHGMRSIVKFRVTDGRHHTKLTVWGDLADKTQTAKENAFETPIIAIVTSTKLKIYKSTVQTSTLPSSKVYLNLDVDPVFAMRQRLIDEGYTAGGQVSGTPSQNKSQQVVETLSLKELSAIENEDYIERYFYCNVKVVTVEEKNWWCDSCGSCEKEVEMREGKYHCEVCKKNIPIAEKRYRVVVLGEDSTDAFNFILLDLGVKRIVGITATKLISEKIQNQTSNVFPTHIKSLAGKDLMLKIVITKDNVRVKSRLYYAVDARVAETPTSVIGSSTGVTSTPSGNGVTSAVKLSQSTNTPGTARSSSKKIKLEK